MHTLPLGDDYMDVIGRATQEAKAEGWGEGSDKNFFILTFSQREKGLIINNATRDDKINF